MQALVLPTEEQVHELLFGLLGREVQLSLGGKIRSKNGGSVAVYVDDEDRVAAFGVSDVPFAAYTGAALALLPARVAHAATESGKIDGELWENFREVANIAASLFCTDGGTHVRLKDTHELTRDLPDDVMSALRKPQGRVVFTVDVADYGRGKVAFAVC